jgi:hypothetical protein
VNKTNTIIVALIILTPCYLSSIFAAPGDSDDDGYSDAIELSEGTDPFDADSKPNDFDNDFIPDSTDTDDDNDGTADWLDDFPLDASEWTDTDGDGIGNNADTDDDNDGYLDLIEEAEGSDPLSPLSKPADCDNDFIPNSTDTDDDNDTHLDASDAFPCNPSEWIDTDGDGIGNNTDADDDNDTVLDLEDSFPLDALEHSDLDGDGIGDNADFDDDGDGVTDDEDLFPTDPSEWTDIDGDGVGDQMDEDSWRDGFETGDLSRWDELIEAFSDEGIIGQAAYSQRYGCQANGSGSLIKYLSSSPHAITLEVWVRFHQWGPLHFSFLDLVGEYIGSITILSEDQIQYYSDNDEIFAHEIPLEEWAQLRLETDVSKGTVRLHVNDHLIYSHSEDRKNVLIGSIQIDSEEGVLVDLDDVGYWIDDDLDNDGLTNDQDLDIDGDEVANENDDFLLDAFEWVDTDGDGIGNNADMDDDGDMIIDYYDDFPLDANEWSDTDKDGIGNNLDSDDDGDGVLDRWDNFPLDADESVGTNDDDIEGNADPDYVYDEYGIVGSGCSLIYK